MKILVIVGPALGILNHTIALSKLLQIHGHHEVSWITSEQSKAHLKTIGFNFPCEYSSNYDINFNRQEGGRKPHLQQVCDLTYLDKGVEYELDIINKLSPDLIITKHHYSPTISARVTRIPYVTYYTDGGEYLLEDRNPQNWNASPELSNNYREVAKKYGLEFENVVVTKYLQSPYLNIIRGIPKLSSLSYQEIKNLEPNSVFGGVLTYDGENYETLSLPNHLPIVYVTFGTIACNPDRLKMIIETLASLPVYGVVSSVHIDPVIFGSLPLNICIKRYIPNQDIMKRASLVIHHGGHGTMLSCFSNGVPQIIIPDNPHSSAQEIHAHTVAKLNCGILLEASTLEKLSLQQAVIQVLNDSVYKKKSHSLQNIIFNQNKQANNNLLSKISHIKSSLKQ